MKFTITREKLHEGLQAVAASVPSKTTLPVLANILVEASKDGLKLSGTDLDISVSTTIPASVDQEGSTRILASTGSVVLEGTLAATAPRPSCSFSRVIVNFIRVLPAEPYKKRLPSYSYT